MMNIMFIRPGYRSACILRLASWTDCRKTHLVKMFFLMFLQILLSWLRWFEVVMDVNSVTNDFNLRTASFNVDSDILAKQTRNHPGSVQWHDDPGEMFKPTSYTIFFHSCSSDSNVSDSNKCLMSTQQNSPALVSRQLIPAFCKPDTSIFCLCFSLFWFSVM